MCKSTRAQPSIRYCCPQVNLLLVLVLVPNILRGCQTSHQHQQTTPSKTMIEIKIPRPVCVLGNSSFPLGHRWSPVLPDSGSQSCVQCECTVRSRGHCYEPYLKCARLARECPEVPEICPNGGGRPLVRRGQCCRTCPEKVGARSLVGLPGPKNHLPANLNFDLTARHETIWLFKFIAKDKDDRELISIVKSVPFCQPANGRAAGKGDPMNSISSLSSSSVPQSVPQRPPPRRESQQQPRSRPWGLLHYARDPRATKNS